MGVFTGVGILRMDPPMAFIFIHTTSAGGHFILEIMKMKIHVYVAEYTRTQRST